MSSTTKWSVLDISEFLQQDQKVKVKVLSIDEENKKIAESIQEKLVNILKNTTRKAKSINEKYLLDNVNKKGCLVELGFLSNKEELTLLTNQSYQEKIAYAIYLGIIEYLGI